jgi:probable F420-dependent oxidoreductase
MQIGVNILNFGPGGSADAFIRWAKISEALGYHSVMISDHVAVTPAVAERYPEPFFDPLMTLAWIAGQTSRIKVGTTVIVLPYRHPILTARHVANLDQFSGGRFIFGVGVGNPQDEYRVLGVEHSKRGAIASDSLRIMKAVWNAESPLTLQSRYFHIEDVAGIPTVQKPHPPIWVGGASEGALRRTVRYGEGWHPNSPSFSALEEGLARLKELAAEEGKPVPAFCPRMKLDIRDEALDEATRVPGAGNFEQVRADMHRMAELGAQHVTLDWNTGELPRTLEHERGWRMLATLAERVFDLPNESLR